MPLNLHYEGFLLDSAEIFKSNERKSLIIPDRQAETAATWMRDNPEIAVVSRDRASAYASAASEAAPHAVQVADRFHVCKNLAEATQLLLDRCQAEIAAAGKGDEPTQNESGQPTISIEEWRPKEPAHVEKVRLTRRAERKARYEQVMQGRSRGLTAKEIAGQLKMSERTVRTWLAAGTFPEARKRRKKPSSFDPFARLSAQTVAGGRAKWSGALA